MARAGYCSACGSYVYLRPDGYCVNGHVPQSVSGIYEAPDELAPPAAFAAPAAVTQPAPVYQAPPQGYGVPVAQPKKKRTGLVVTIVLLLVIACGVVAAVAGVMTGVIPNPAGLLSSPEHQKVAAAGDFIEALSTANLVLFRKTLPTDAANAANPAYWIKKLAESKGVARLESKTWKGDELTMVFVSSDGTKRQFVITAAPNSDKVTAASGEVGSSDPGSPMMLGMVREVGGYKVLALLGEDGSEFIKFTAAEIKKIETENP